jgi:ABC-type phosphate transport system substrate-binding protein
MSSRRHLALAFVCCALLLATAHASPGAASDIAVIVNKANPAKALTDTELRPIFQTTKTSWPHGEDAFPVNLPDGDALRQEFDAAVLRLDAERVARYWKDRKIRGGARAPVQAPNTQAVLKVVALKPGGVGYVRASEVNDSVRVVARIAGGKLLPP